MSDANWGPQDASSSKMHYDLPLFASRSMSTFYIDLLGPLHWVSKRQSVTAGSSAEAEIYATDEYVKFLLELVQILDFLEVKYLFMPATNMSTMTIKPVLIGPSHALPKVFIIFR